MHFSSWTAPVAEMAELTPSVWGAILNIYGGLRSMAEYSNVPVCELYASEFGYKANVVAVDFHLNTNLVETAIKINGLGIKPEEII